MARGDREIFAVFAAIARCTHESPMAEMADFAVGLLPILSIFDFAREAGWVVQRVLGLKAAANLVAKRSTYGEQLPELPIFWLSAEGELGGTASSRPEGRG